MDRPALAVRVELCGGQAGPDGWGLRDWAAGGIRRVRLDELVALEQAMRADGASESAELLRAQVDTLASIAEAWREQVARNGVER
ncbi:MAG: hypothetical protein ACRD2C_20680 [Acidimicrobiales bacterium]